MIALFYAGDKLISPTIKTEHLLIALGSITVWGILLVISRGLLIRYQFDPWSFACIQLIGGGLTLIAFSTGETVDWRSLRRISTWCYGVLRVVSASAFTTALVHVSVVYAGLLGVMNVPVAMIAVWFLFSRKPVKWEWLGHVAIGGGIVLLIVQLDGGIDNPAVLWMAVTTVSTVTSSMIAEKHPDNNNANPLARRRFTGVVLLITAILFLVWRIVQTASSGYEEAQADRLASVVFDMKLWGTGIILGGVFRGPAMHLSLQSIRLVGADTYLIVVAMLPFMGWIFELLAIRMGLLQSSTVPFFHLVTGFVIVGSCVLVIIGRARKVVEI